MVRLSLSAAVVVLVASGCASVPRPVALDAQLAQEVGPIAERPDDVLRAYAEEAFLTGVAGHGLSHDLDLSAACGCAETSSSGPTASSGPGSGPGVEHKQRAIVRIRVEIPVPE